MLSQVQAARLKKGFLNYVIPSVAAMWVFTIYTMVDGIFVAKGVGPMALAGVNIAMPFINFSFAVALMFATGASTVSAIHMGQNDQRGANESFSMNVVLVAVISLVLTAFCLLNLERIALFLGATDKTLTYVMDYLRIVVCFDICYMVAYALEVLVKTDGFPRIATLTITVGAAANIVLDYVFVMRFSWGIKGAAWATGFSQLLTLVIFIFHFVKGESRLRFVAFSVTFQKVWRVMCLGFSDCITEFSTGITIFMFNNALIRVVGDKGVVIYTIIAYVNSLIVMTMTGITQGMQPLVSFYYGKEDKPTCSYLLKLAMRYAIVCSAAAFLIGVTYPQPVVSTFIDKTLEPELFKNAVFAFRLFSVSFLFVGINIILAGFYTAVERPRYAIIVSLGRGLVLMALSLAVLSALFGEVGIWLTTTLSEILCMATAGYIFKKHFMKEIILCDRKINI